MTFIVCLIAVTSAGCSFFDREAQDKSACDKLSQVMVAQYDVGLDATSIWKSAMGTGPETKFAVFVSEVQAQVLPLASMRFAGTLNSFISSAQRTSSNSIFDVATGYSESTEKFSQVLARCLEVSGGS